MSQYAPRTVSFPVNYPATIKLTAGARHSSLFSFRRPQCVSLRSGLNSRATCRFNARMRPMRANIVGPLESDELATVRSRIGSSNGRDQLIQEAGNKQHRGRAPSITKTERRRSANLLQMPRGLMCKLRQRGRSFGGPAGSRGIDPSLQPPPAVAASPLREIGNPCLRPSPSSSLVPKRRQCRRPSRCHAAAFFLGRRVRDVRHAAPAPPQSSHIEQIIGVLDSALSRPIGANLVNFLTHCNQIWKPDFRFDL
ncbi:MAG: hypothetical protein QOJ15_7402 [Bradyrhizobium sp.]|nr:hypothetical protein [Bradyrhizobium sp.]